MSESELDHIATIVVARISANPTPMTMIELRDCIKTVRQAFGDPAVAPIVEIVPAGIKKSLREVKASIQQDGLVSFEDGRKYKMLKRHIARLGMTPAQYREKHGLHPDYPMVAPEYSRARSVLAKKIGLGTVQR